ncbi:FecR domain-containing protein, partial [Chloroflexota bacterium]
METKLAQVLDECLVRIKKGEAADACLTQDTSLWRKIEPLLNTALSVSAAPKAAPSKEFIETVEGHLAARYQNNLRLAAEKTGKISPLINGPALTWQNILQSIAPMRKVIIPVTLALILLIAASFGAANLLSPSPVLASQCTLSLLSGRAEFQKPGSEKWQPGTDGMTLVAGSRVRTAADSHALLTFFEGSTLSLEPNTNIEIQQVERGEQQTTTIILKQWTGRTWSRVIKMTDQGSRYEIETPTAVAAVRGTLFATEVDETGSTEVTTTSGLVSVVAQGEEVLIPPKQLTRVETGKAPSVPMLAAEPMAEILVSVNTPAVVSVIDPTGASTGYLPGGTSFNQIPGSQSISTDDGNQRITITEPISGEYTVILRYINEGTASVSMQGISAGNLAFGYGGEYRGARDNDWLIRINVQVADGLIIGSEVSGMESLTKQTPEKVVKTLATGVQPAPDEAQNNNQDEASSQNRRRVISIDNGPDQTSSPSPGQSNGQSDSPDQGNSSPQGKNNAQGNISVDQGNNSSPGQGNDKNNNGIDQT